MKIIKRIHDSFVDLGKLPPASAHSYTEEELRKLYDACDNDYERSFIADRLYFVNDCDKRLERKTRNEYSFYPIEALRRRMEREVPYTDTFTA